MSVSRPILAKLSKIQLHRLADDMLAGVSGSKEEAVRFFGEETTEIWHNRARALIARRVKNIPMTDEERSRLVGAVLARLANGKISEQFRDQLRMALHLDRAATLRCAEECLSSEKPHVVRFAEWVLSHQESEPSQAPGQPPTSGVAHL